MPGNPDDSPWRSTPNASRKRKKVSVTLSDDARKALEKLAAAAGKSASAVVEDLILTAQRFRR